MVTIVLEEAEIPGAVLSRDVDESGTAIVTLRMVEGAVSEGYEVYEWFDGKYWVNAFDELEEAFATYQERVRYFQSQADYYSQFED